MAKSALTKLGIFQNILNNFPGPIRVAFGYGSGVFKQANSDPKKNMLDFIFVVDDTKAWHKENLSQHRDHYSFLKYFGSNLISHYQDEYGARVYYNTLVPFEDRIIKYGVINTKHFINDVLDWDTLYVSGRLQKPVLILHEGESDYRVKQVMKANLRSAFHTALLLLPDTFSEEDLYFTITGLSYSGDFRMKVGEDKDKVSNIVKPMFGKFRQLYESILDAEKHLHWNKADDRIEQGVNPRSVFHHLNLVPKTLLENIIILTESKTRVRDSEEVLRALSHDSQYSEVVSNGLTKIVGRSSLTQSVKGILTAGLTKSVKYSGSKVKKMWSSYKR